MEVIEFVHGKEYLIELPCGHRLIAIFSSTERGKYFVYRNKQMKIDILSVNDIKRIIPNDQ